MVGHHVHCGGPETEREFETSARTACRYYFTATPNGKLSVAIPVVVGLRVPVAGVIEYCDMLAEL
jgi:hypothetical protein